MLIFITNRKSYYEVSHLGFVTAPTSLNGGQRNFARCLAVSWAGILYIFFRGLLPPNRILPGAKFTLRPSLAFSYIGSVTARHSSSGHQPVCSVVQGMELRNFRRARHLYSAGRPSRWASAHTHSINSALVLLQASADVNMKLLTSSAVSLADLRLWHLKSISIWIRIRPIHVSWLQYGRLVSRNV